MCMKLADLPASEVRKRARALLVPVGSLEDHGPLPLGLDTMIAERVACSVRNVVVSPSINYSFSPEHPFSVTISLSVLTEYLLDLTGQLYKLFRVPVIYVVAHKGAVPVINSVVMESHKYGIKVAAMDLWAVIESMGYRDFQDLCRAEASLALALGYSVVVRKAKRYKSPPQLEGALIPWHSGEYGCSPESVSEARKEEGEQILRRLSDAVAKLVDMLAGPHSG
ncbi:MAG: creatininase family protein [Crenarchaeota archaeon]|nr:creatininase family protein [Thermoproteota archaeon]